MIVFYLVLPFLFSVESLNILVYSPSFAGSHTNFMARIADTLTDAGHNVTFLVPVVDEARKDQLGVGTTKNVIVVEQDPEMKSLAKPCDNDMDKYWSTEVNSDNIDTIFSSFNEAMNLSCHNFLRNKKVFEEMKSRNFDVGIYEPLFVCGLGFMAGLGIKKTIMASSCTFFHGVIDVIGEPLDLSHVPAQMGRFEYRNDEKMSLAEKVENYKVSMALTKLNFDIWDLETTIYQKYLGSDVPDWRELMESSSLHFANSIPYLDFPRTITQKTIPIGGISVNFEILKSQKLDDKWTEVLNKRPNNMLISFGSLVRSKDMPEEWRFNLLRTIESEPNVTFIWKYEDDDVSFAKDASNIHFSKWVPQLALLNDARLTAFMTHGGLGSTNELAHLGKPALMLPIFADQYRNANMLARHGGACVIMKNDLGDLEKLRKAIHSILFKELYKKNSEKLAELLRNQPMKPKEQVVKYVEFVAKFGPFPRMNSISNKLGFVEKYLLDVYFVIALPYVVGSLVIVLVFRLTKHNFESNKIN